MGTRPVTPLKLAIIASGREQREIAMEAGLSESHLSRIVNGLHTDEVTREAIAAALGCPLAVLWPDLHDAQPDDAPAGSDETDRKAA
jgi:transcriptional regulator with XRE-family HTH domain